MAENETHLDSIQGRIDLFTNSLQTMWMNFINSDAIKFVVDLGSAVLKLVDAMGVIPIAVGGFTVFKSAAADIKKEFDAINNGAIKPVEIFKDDGTLDKVANSISNITKARTKDTEASKVASEASEEYHQISMDEIVANTDRAESTNEATAAKTQDVAVTNASTAGRTAETGAIVANTAATKANIIATKALSAAKAIGVGILKGLVAVLAAKAITAGISAIAKGIDNVIHRAENLKEEVSELQDTYKKAQDTFDENLNTLTTSSDTSVYATLQDEFNALAQGVDQYGNNISLTSDQYERYKQICEQIVGIQPGLAAGYDSATQAISANKNALADLIELQKEQARLNAADYVSDENLKKLAEDAANDYRSARTQSSATQSSSSNDLLKVFQKSMNFEDISQNNTANDEIMSYVLQKLGYESGEITKKIQEYYSQALLDYDTSRFFSDYSEEIKNNIDQFGVEQQDALYNAFSKIESAISSSDSKLKEAENGLIDTFLQVPRSLEGYDQFNDASKNFITNWIKNSEQFKVSANQTEEAAKASRDKIIDVIKNINSGLTVDFEGQQITGQDLLDKFYNFDNFELSTVNWDEYKTKINSFVQSLSQLTGIEEADIKVALNIDFEEKEKNKQTYIDQIDGHIDLTADQIQSRLDNMNAKQIKAFYEIDWNEVDWGNVTSWEDVRNLINQQAEKMGDTVSVKTYADVSAAVDNFNDIQSQTADIIADNTEVSQDYKTALEGLGASEEELNDIFDESNPLLVKNAALLQKLVAQKRQEQAANVKVAKSQAMQQYKQTTLQLGQLTIAMQKEYQAQGKVSEGTLKASEILHSQIDALKQTIQQYALLELKLSDAAKAYDEYEAAKARDAEVSYGDSAVEMLNTISEGLETGKVGTEAFQAAVKAMIPSSVYEDCDTVAEKMQAIYDYAYKDPVFTQFFKWDGEQFSIAYDQVDNFVAYCQKKKIFTGEDSSHFDLSDDVDSLDDFANQLGITQSAALAMLTELSKYDGEWSNILAKISLNPLERDLYDATTALEQAQIAQENFIKSGGDLNSDKWKELCANTQKATEDFNNNTVAAQNNASQWIQLQTIYDAACGKIKLTQEEVDTLAKSLGIVGANGEILITVNDDGTISLADEAVTMLNEKRENLKEPTIMSVQPNVDQWQQDIDGLQKAIDNKDFTADVAVKYGVTDKEGAQNQINTLQKLVDTSGLHFNATATQDSTLEKLADWEANGMTFTISANTEQLDAAVNEVNETEMEEKEVPINGNDEQVQATFDEVNGVTLPDKNVTMVETGANTVISQANSVANAVNNIPSEKTISINYQSNGIGNLLFGNSSNANGTAHASGTAHSSGTAHAQGDWGAPKTETALVGELGPELVNL